MLKQEAKRILPPVHRILSHALCKKLVETYSHEEVSCAVAEEIEGLRTQLNDYEENEIYDVWWKSKVSPESIISRVNKRLLIRFEPSLRQVLNLTGVIIHTNLGRAVLSPRAVAAVMAVASSYNNLEFNLMDGKRGSRHAHIEERICRLTGAEAALVVNNNAAGVLLVLSEMAGGKEAIVSRGQLVEIGGSFRIPDVMEASGVSLVEVGTTNKTKLADYERAFSDDTELVVRVHTSNYRVVGFTEQPELCELVALTHKYGFPIYEDLGSGALFDFESFGIGDEKSVRFSIESGVDVVSFSGDKLLGGPQAGIVVGRKEWIDRMKKNPLLRALRPDKMTIAALEATLVDYELRQEKESIPVVRMLTETADAVHGRAIAVYEQLQAIESSVYPLSFSLMKDEACIGGGALPMTTLESTSIVVHTNGYSANKLLTVLRTVPEVPIIGRIVDNNVLLNLRTLMPQEEVVLQRGLVESAQFFRGSAS